MQLIYLASVRQTASTDKTFTPTTVSNF